MKRAIVFPGQGSQQVGMGREFAENFSMARLVYEEVDEALGQKLSKLMFEGPEEELTLTENAQPAIMANSIAILRALEKEKNIKAETFAAYFAGHSLGEYTALCAAKALTLADTARLLKLRGQAMQKAVPEGEGAMVALIGFSVDKVAPIISSMARYGVCAIANDNSPDQIVVSGKKKLVEQTVEMAKADSGVKAIMLQVSAPFHCLLMQPAEAAMEEALAKIDMKTPTRPIVNNVTGTAATDPVELKKLLVQQISGMVRWRESVQFMARQGVGFALEVGAGKVLSGLIRRTEPGMGALSLNMPRDIEAFETPN
jgi:[acyl-carrier-protein] S-malonyltransferase